MKNTKVVLSLLAVALAGGIALTGCGGGKNKKGDSSGQGSTPASEPSSEPDPEPVYTFTEAEYLLVKEKLNDPRILLNGNFTMSGIVENKIAEGKIDGTIEGDHLMYDIDVASYNNGTKKAAAVEYYYDTDDAKWYRTEIDLNVQSLYVSTGLYYFMLLPVYGDLTYNETKHQYSALVNYEEMNFKIDFRALHGNIIEYNVTGEVTYHFEFSDFGTTTVEFPTDYEEGSID